MSDPTYDYNNPAYYDKVEKSWEDLVSSEGYNFMKHSSENYYSPGVCCGARTLYKTYNGVWQCIPALFARSKPVDIRHGFTSEEHYTEVYGKDRTVMYQRVAKERGLAPDYFWKGKGTLRDKTYLYFGIDIPSEEIIRDLYSPEFREQYEITGTDFAGEGQSLSVVWAKLKTDLTPVETQKPEKELEEV